MVLNLKYAHQWDLSLEQAKELQLQLSQKVTQTDDFSAISFIAGIDIGFENDNTITRAAAVILTYPDLCLYETSLIKIPTEFPYIPGYLSFREIPAALEALKQLKQLPDLIICDGQGIAHPRRFGLACHLGVLTDIPCIGAAKSRLTGSYQPVPSSKGSWVQLLDHEECIGAVLRTKDNTNPLFISVGHKICLNSATQIVLNCVTKYRLPETTRWAHKLASNKL